MSAHTVVHRELDGSWAVCRLADVAGVTCPLLFHFENMSIAELAALPERLLWPLLEAIQPPDYASPNGAVKRWLAADTFTQHRDYDLPAEICDSGAAMWYQNGQLHRAHDRPANIGYEGTQEWYWRGKPHREHGPAVINSNGIREFYEHGRYQGYEAPIDDPHQPRPWRGTGGRRL